MLSPSCGVVRGSHDTRTEGSVVEQIETLTQFAQSEGVSAKGLAAAERAGLLDVHRAGGRRLVICETVTDEALDYAHDFDADDGGEYDRDDGGEYDDDE